MNIISRFKDFYDFKILSMILMILLSIEEIPGI
jgi:hypothetical protein